MGSAIFYGRVSKGEQKLGPDAQLEACKAWCKVNELEIREQFIDHGVSGAAKIHKRTGLLDAINALKRGDVLVVAKRCRLGRDFSSTLALESMVKKKGATIECADGAGNGDKPEDLLLRRMLDAFAEYERVLIAARTRAALRQKRLRGYRAGCLPFGYTADESGQLEVNPAEWKKVMRMKALREEGLSYRRIAEKLKDENIQGRRGFLMFQQVRKILINHAKYPQPENGEEAAA
jgi:DNA invertase Pin-like site-specific DNA recombinase